MLRVGRGLQLGTTLRFHLGNLLTEKRVMGIHPQHPTTQTRRNRRPIPQPQRLELLGQLGQARHPQPLTTEEALDAGRGTGPLLLQGFQVPVQMAVILGLDRGHLDHLPHLTLALRDSASACSATCARPTHRSWPDAGAG